MHGLHVWTLPVEHRSNVVHQCSNGAILSTCCHKPNKLFGGDLPNKYRLNVVHDLPSGNVPASDRPIPGVGVLELFGRSVLSRRGVRV